MTKSRALVWLVCLALATIVADGADGQEGAGGMPPLRWGAAVDSNAPYAFYGPGNILEGFEYEIIHAIAKEMGRKPQFVSNSWDGLIPGLDRGLYDMVICGIEITPAKSAEVLFSNPYYVTYEQFVTAKGTPILRSLDSMKGKKVGTLNHTSAMAMLEKVDGVEIKPYEEEINAYNDIVNGRIFGVLLDFPIAKYYAQPNPELEFNGPPFGQITYGIAFSKSNQALCDEVNQAIDRVIASGEMRDILSRWGLWTEMVAGAFKQPAAPSCPDSEYRDFVKSHHQYEKSLWDRICGYAQFWPLLLRGSLMTLQVSIFGMTLAIALGFSLAILRVYGPWPLQVLSSIYIEIIRGTPLLVQLLIIFYGLPNIGIKLHPLVAGILGLGLNYAAYEAENYRAGLLAIPKGQMEAAMALGMSHFQGLRYVVVPQSFRIVLPPVTNDFISLLKDSSLVSMVTLLDLTGAYNRIATQTFDYFGSGLLVAAIYLLIGLPFVRLARWAESTMAVDHRKSGNRPGRFSLPVPFRKKGETNGN